MAEGPMDGTILAALDGSESSTTENFPLPRQTSSADSASLFNATTMPLLDFAGHLLRLFALGGAVFVCGLYLLHIVAIVYGRYRLHRTQKPWQKRQAKEPLVDDIVSHQWPGVSILKPVIGLDSHLEQNLESFFTLDYPQYELLFCLTCTDDPAYRMIEALGAKYPLVQKQIFVGGSSVGLNPKINNMYPGYLSSRYPLILVSDQNIFMQQLALRDMVSTMLERPNIALVTQPPYCRDRGDSFGAALEQVYFGGAHSRIYLASHAFGFVCSTGMSSLIIRKVIEQCGGFKQFGAYLAEDYFLGQAFIKAGYVNVISHMPALQNAANPSAWNFQERICRWIKLRIAMLPHTILLEPAQECMVSSALLALFIGQFVCAAYIPPLLTLHFLYWCLCDYLLLRTVQNGPPPFSLATFVLCWLFRELMAFPIFVKAVLNPHISWRLGTYRLCWGGRIKPPPKQR